MDADLTQDPIKTTCPYCGVGCGVLVAPDGAGARVTGDPDHPANAGRLCSKGAALGETLGLEGRLLHPRIGARRVGWDEALDSVAGRFRAVIDRHGPDAVAFYVSGQLLTEDYYVANKLMKGFIGSANIDTNSRLCMASAVAGYKRAFGSDTVPCDYHDLERADLLVLVGSNTAWCHPVLFQRIKQAKQERPSMQVVLVDPRRTATSEIADLHLPLASGTDTLLFNGLLDYLRREDSLDWAFLERSTEGFAETFSRAREAAPSIPAVAAGCGLREQDVADFYRRFARTERTVTLYSQGVNQWSFGTDKVNAIINCHLATGRVGRPGMGPFSITGQPNAMGGREVGGLANQLAAHMDFSTEAVARVGRFWEARSMAERPGLRAVDMLRAVEAGRIKAIWIMATNPAVSMPDADRVRAALQGCDFVVVSDVTEETDTAACADVLLPAAAWGEKEGTVTNSERRISRQRAFAEAPGEARPDWWIITQVARRMGFEPAFPYESPAEVFREHAALTAFENGGRRALDLGGLTGLDDAAYDRLRPVQWPVPANGAKGRPFDQGRFPTASGRARMVPIVPRAPANEPDDEYPLSLNTGRIRDQWHTMTRTARAPRLNGHAPEPYVQIHPVDAGPRGLTNGGLALITSRWGQMLARVAVDRDQRPGSLFVPMHWSDVSARRARADALVNPALDPISGQPEFKHTPVRISAFEAAWYGFILSREPIEPGEEAYLVRVRGNGHWRYEIAGIGDEIDFHALARDRLGDDGEWIDFADPAAGRYRGARLEDGRLSGCLFAARTSELPGRGWLGGLFAPDELDAAARLSLLAGRPARGQSDAGEIVCACFAVGLNTIRDTLRGGRIESVEALGAALRAGTNCGSCLPELARILEAERTRPAA
jgi:assimilatory nitrate reductase catalytic subunit